MGFNGKNPTLHYVNVIEILLQNAIPSVTITTHAEQARMATKWVSISAYVAYH